jgi:hypothetical protein
MCKVQFSKHSLITAHVDMDVVDHNITENSGLVMLWIFFDLWQNSG